jgi:hypothetical protein
MTEAPIPVRSWPLRRSRKARALDPFVQGYQRRRRQNPELALARVQRNAPNLLNLADGRAPLRTTEIRERLDDQLRRRRGV